MSTYRVTIAHDACTTHDVEADTEQAAIGAAWKEAGVCLCHQCSEQIELGDPFRTVYVENLDTGELNDDPEPEPDQSTVDLLRARIAELERACEVFVTWLDREEAGFANVGARDTPAGEAEWREWYDENLRLCSLAQSLARAAIEEATKP